MSKRPGLRGEGPRKGRGDAEAGKADRDRTWSPELVETLTRLAVRAERDSLELVGELRDLEEEYGEVVYSEWLRLATRMSFEPKVAKRHFRRAESHRQRMQEALGQPVARSIAVASYFVEVEPQFEAPVAVEIRQLGRSRDLAYSDPLTGLRDVRFFVQNLEREIQRSRYSSEPLSLLMIDVDDFKRFNDREGQEAGDRTLAAIGRLVDEVSRTVGEPARFGGEEFTLTLPATSKLAAGKIAEQLRRAVEKRFFPGEDKQPRGKVTVSVGVATYPADAEDSTELVRHADRAMYVAKASGKNQVRLYGEDRRSHQRVDVALDGSFGNVEAETHNLRTVDVSLGGVKFTTDEDLPVGALVDLRLWTPGSGPGVEMAVRVVKSEVLRLPSVGWIAGREHSIGGSYLIAARMIDISTDDLGRLAEHLDETRPEE